jgi:hypothetical protein
LRPWWQGAFPGLSADFASTSSMPASFKSCCFSQIYFRPDLHFDEHLNLTAMICVKPFGGQFLRGTDETQTMQMRAGTPDR